jgi:glutamine---fructose-6-phosphate transaminase (isomerizing)
MAPDVGADDSMTHMREEVFEVPAVVERLLRDGAARLDEAAAAIRARRPRFATIVARGTSDNAGTYARYLLETHVGMPAGMAAPSITTVYHAATDWRDVLVLAVSQSGQSPDIVAVTDAARRAGALAVAITNDSASPVGSAADYVLECFAGREQAVAATKTYVASLAVIAGLVARLEETAGLLARLPDLPAVLSATLDACGPWLDSQASEPPIALLAAADRALVVSRGYNLATAQEVALKLKETSRIFADGYSTADLEHGPIALAAAEVPLVVIRPDGAIGEAIDRGIDRARARGARPLLIGGRDVADRRRRGDPQELVLPVGLPEALTPLAYVLPGQLLAEAVAARRGLDPDAPVGLTKVTRTT